MGALPNKKVTKSRQGSRFVAYRLKPVHVSHCPQCRSARLSHRVCRHCGYYNGRKVIEIGET